MFNSKSQPSPQAAAVLRQAASIANASSPAAAPAPASAAPAGTTIPLTKPLVTHQGPKNELVVRAPTFTDYIEIGDIDGLVSSMDANGRPAQLEVKTNHEAIMRWASALTGLDRVVLSQLSPGDAGQLIRMVRVAIAPFAQGNSPATPTS